MWLVVIGLIWGVVWGVLVLVYGIYFWFGWLVEVWMIFIVLVGCCLVQLVMVVVWLLQVGDFVESWYKFFWIVGCDIFQFQLVQINCVVVEIVVENMVDGIIVLFFFLFFGGVLLVMVYKVVNIFDFMVGYKYEKYWVIGMVSVCFDDVVNFFFVWLSWLLFSFVVVLCWEDGVWVLCMGWCDCYQYSSFNCVWLEVIVVGVLGICFGGLNDYFGQCVEKFWIGDVVCDIVVDDIF